MHEHRYIQLARRPAVASHPDMTTLSSFTSLCPLSMGIYFIQQNHPWYPEHLEAIPSQYSSLADAMIPHRQSEAHTAIKLIEQRQCEARTTFQAQEPAVYHNEVYPRVFGYAHLHNDFPKGGDVRTPTHKNMNMNRKVTLRVDWSSYAEYSSKSFGVKSKRGVKGFKKLVKHVARNMLQLGKQRSGGVQRKASLRFKGDLVTIANLLLKHTNKRKACNLVL